MIPYRLVDCFIHNHYGFGNPKGKYWLVGMEEGCGDGKDELIRRFQVWDVLGRNETDDVADYHRRLGMPQFFQEPVKLQHTWAHLIRLVLSADDKSTDLASVKAYQKDSLGRQDADTCLLELLPLPSPNMGLWNYKEWTGLPDLQDREGYRQTCIPWRVAHLREMIQKYHPPVVVFYGVTYRPFYKQVAGCSFEKNGDLESAREGNSLFVLVKHPAAWGQGANAAYFERVGRAIHLQT